MGVFGAKTGRGRDFSLIRQYRSLEKRDLDNPCC